MFLALIGVTPSFHDYPCPVIGIVTPVVVAYVTGIDVNPIQDLDAIIIINAMAHAATNGIHIGANTHNQLHAITSVSLRMINARVNRLRKPIPPPAAVD